MAREDRTELMDKTRIGQPVIESTFAVLGGIVGVHGLLSQPSTNSSDGSGRTISVGPVPKQNSRDLKKRSDRSHVSSRGIMNEDQLLNFIEAQCRFYSRNWREMARGEPLVDELDEEIKKENSPGKFVQVPQRELGSRYDPVSGRRFRAQRGLTGLYSAVKGNPEVYN